MAATASNPPPEFLSTTADSSSSASISAVHSDILATHILTRLDGLSLASISCSSTELNSLASNQDLWANICHSTWPSTRLPLMRQVISSFADGPRSFFSHSFPLLDPTVGSPASDDLNRPSELISAVDIYYRGSPIFSKVVQTETTSAWFSCSPFRIDMLDPKDTCPTPIPHPESNCGSSCDGLADDLSLSWILVDTAGRAVNLSSYKPVTVQRHWLSGEVHARFASVVARRRGSSLEFVHCGVLVTCGGGAREGGMHVREVSLQVEDLDGMFLSGRDSLGILRGALEGKKGIRGMREQEGKKIFEEFLEMKKERKERKLKAEGTLDMLCVTLGVLIFSSIGIFAFFQIKF